MKLSEAKERIDKLVDWGRGDHTFCIPIQGIGGPRVEITSIACGFDWYDHTVCVSGKEILSRIDERRYSKLKELYLSKISNLRQIDLDKTTTARYKKEEKSFEKKWEAVNWLYDKLKEELKEHE